MSPEYNAMQHFKFNYDNMPDLVDCYDMKEFRKSCTNPTIVHFSSSHKPWKENKLRFYNEWDKYRKIAESKLYDNPPIKDGTYVISSALNNNKVLDISGGSKKNGANLQLWDRGSNVPAQKFKLTYVGAECYEIEAVCSGKVLDVERAGKGKGTNVWQYKKNNTSAQKWIIKSASDGYYSIISKCNGLCLDVDKSRTSNGTNIQMWEYNATNAQKFRISRTK